MSTYIINSEPELTAGDVDDADELVIYDASSDITKKVSMASVRQFVDSGVVAVTAGTLALTAAAHAGRIVTLETLTGTTLTLPAATGTGNVYTVVIKTAATSNAHVVETSATSEHMTGSVRGVDDDGEGATGYQWNSETSDDTVTMDGTATGGKPGDILIFRDYVATNYTVEGSLTQSGASEATPFSASVS
jgi:hypothetical protein